MKSLKENLLSPDVTSLIEEYEEVIKEFVDLAKEPPEKIKIKIIAEGHIQSGQQSCTVTKWLEGITWIMIVYKKFQTTSVRWECEYKRGNRYCVT